MITEKDVTEAGYIEVGYIEKRLGRPYSGLSQLRRDIRTLFDIQVYPSSILTYPRKKGLEPLKCLSDTLSRAMRSIESTPGDSDEKWLLSAEVKNVGRYVNVFIKIIEEELAEREQGLIGYERILRRVREKGIEYHKRREMD